MRERERERVAQQHAAILQTILKLKIVMIVGDEFDWSGASTAPAI